MSTDPQNTLEKNAKRGNLKKLEWGVVMGVQKHKMKRTYSGWTPPCSTLRDKKRKTYPLHCWRNATADSYWTG